MGHALAVSCANQPVLPVADPRPAAASPLRCLPQVCDRQSRVEDWHVLSLVLPLRRRWDGLPRTDGRMEWRSCDPLAASACRASVARPVCLCFALLVLYAPFTGHRQSVHMRKVRSSGGACACRRCRHMRQAVPTPSNELAALSFTAVNLTHHLPGAHSWLKLALSAPRSSLPEHRSCRSPSPLQALTQQQPCRRASEPRCSYAERPPPCCSRGGWPRR